MIHWLPGYRLGIGLRIGIGLGIGLGLGCNKFLSTGQVFYDYSEYVYQQ